MIAIINKSDDHGLVYGEGLQVYSLQINNRVLGYFDHNFEDGLSTCLRKATKCAKRFEKREDK